MKVVTCLRLSTEHKGKSGLGGKRNAVCVSRKGSKPEKNHRYDKDHVYSAADNGGDPSGGMFVSDRSHTKNATIRAE